MFLDDLERSERPAILCGGGAYRARDEIAAFAMAHCIPCFRTWNAQDIITDDLPVYCGTVGTYGGPGRNFGIQNCDLLLSLGCRMSGRITGGMPETFARGARKYIVDVDEVALTPELQQVKGDVNIKQDCGEFIASLDDEVQSFDSWLARCRVWLTKYDPVTPAMLASQSLHHYGFMRRLSELLPSNAIIVSDTGGNVIMMGHCFRSKRGQRIFTSNGNTPMGFAMCGAIGAWFAEQTRPIVCIIGDGGMSMNIQELQTLVNYGVAIKIFIINNHVLGNTASYQRVNSMQNVACAAPDYVPPNFIQVCMAYGIPAVTLDKADNIERRVIVALSSNGPIVVDVVHHDYCTYEPRISRFDLPIEDMFPFIPRDEFRANMVIDPLDGWETNK